MTEKRTLGSVYCIVEIDKFGKCKNGYVPLENVKLNPDKETLLEKLASQDKEIRYLKGQLKVLTGAFKKIIESIGGIKENETT